MEIGCDVLGKGTDVPFLITDREIVALFGGPMLHFKNCFRFGRTQLLMVTHP